ncbi:hypothetical protein PPROV_000431400 [Pycnococcus provasolii]|uniref:Uncharacterized protein n=1 Tax=Pycnococcus provasolii TaxID=41880 RepID=A0A830HEU5_9CHLO|nr:hypothetical protein PPROV_000431400 [Pycnococcus provasolii]
MTTAATQSNLPPKLANEESSNHHNNNLPGATTTASTTANKRPASTSACSDQEHNKRTKTATFATSNTALANNNNNNNNNNQEHCLSSRLKRSSSTTTIRNDETASTSGSYSSSPVTALLDAINGSSIATNIIARLVDVCLCELQLTNEQSTALISHVCGYEPLHVDLVWRAVRRKNGDKFTALEATADSVARHWWRDWEAVAEVLRRIHETLCTLVYAV